MALLIACVPLAWLAFVNTTFAFDWNNHLWMIAYTGEYVRRHISWPLTFNTHEIAGSTIPLFYGSLFYPVAGVVSIVTGAALALRLIVVALFWLQCIQIVKLVRAIYPEPRVAWAMAAVVSFAVYPLTNLYNRSAITEFVAVSLLTSASAILLRVFYGGEARGHWRAVLLAWLLLALSAGSHPITAVLGGALIVFLVVVGLRGTPGRRAVGAPLLVGALLYLLVLSPWLYVTLKFQHQLSITSAVEHVILFRDSIDLWWVRLLPVPFDIRVYRAGAAGEVGTPYLDAQINAGLLIIACVLSLHVGRRLRSRAMPLAVPPAIGMTTLVLFALVCFSTVSPGIWGHLPRSFAFFQFAYRLVSYCDLLLLAACVALLVALKPFHEEIHRSLTMCLVVASGVMTLGVPIKLAHAAAIWGEGEVPGSAWRGDRERLSHMPGTLYWIDYGDRVDRTGFAGPVPAGPTLQLGVGGGAHFGEAESALSVAPADWIHTNVVAFPWNRIVVDGREVPTADTHTVDRLFSVAVPEGGHLRPHVVGYRFSPDRAYITLRWTSGLVLAGWCGALLVIRRRAAA